MARTVSSSGRSRRSSPRISAPICSVSGTTSNRVRVKVAMVSSAAGATSPALLFLLSSARRRVVSLRRHGRGRVVSGLAVLDFAALQGGEDLRNELARGLGAQFHRHALASALRLVDEIDAERMVERRMEGVVVVDVGGV